MLEVGSVYSQCVKVVAGDTRPILGFVSLMTPVSMFKKQKTIFPDHV